LKIAILSCFYPYRGGISQFNASLLTELSKNNMVKAFNFKRQYPNFLFPGKTQYVTENDNALSIESYRILDTANPFSYIKTAKEIKKWHPDLLIMRYWMSYFAPSQGWVARHINKDCKVISILDNVIPHEPKFFDKPFTKYYLKSNDAFITLCDSVKKDLLDFAPSSKCIVSFHPQYSHFGEKIERSAAEKFLRLSPNKKNLLFFGLIREYKGLDILLNAFALLDDSYQLIIAGEPYGSFDKYEKIINNLRNKNNIRLVTKYIPDNEVPYYFSASDVCVLPYRSATQSGISAISYHFDLPMITTPVGGLKETISDKGTGIVVDDISVAAIIKAINKYFSEKDNKIAFQKNIRIEKERLSWSNFCKDLMNLYNNI